MGSKRRMKKNSGAVTGIPMEHVDPPIWAASLHRELKKEFLEVYKDDFPPDRLDFLAHAYANVELQHCRYPDSIMREIKVLAQSLLGVDKFLNRKSRTVEKKSASGGSSQVNGGQIESPEKMAVGHTKHKSCTGAIESESTSSKKKILLGEKSSSHKESYENQKACSSSQNVSKNGACCMTTSHSIEDGLSIACQNMSVLSLSTKPSSSSGYNSTNQKTKKALEEAYNKRIASSSRGSFSVPRAANPNPRTTNQKRRSVCFDTRKLYGLPLIQAFKAEFFRQLEVQDFVPAASKTADLLRIFLKFVYRERSGYIHTTMFDCDFHLKDIIMATAQGSSKKAAKYNAVRTAHEMLMNSEYFVIQIEDDKKYVESAQRLADNVFSNVRNRFAASSSKSNSPKIFSLNYDLLYTSLQLRFVLFDNNENRPMQQRSAMLLLNDSAKLCQTALIYDSVTTPQSFTSVTVKLRGEEIGSALTKNEAEARRIATEMALDKLRKEIYTIKVKKEDSCGIFITPQKIFENRACDILLSKNTDPDKLKTCGPSRDTSSSSASNHPEFPYRPSEHSLEALQTDKKLLQTLLNKIDELFRQFSTSKIFDDIIFSTEFSGRDRTEFSKIASSHNLQTLFRKIDNCYYLRVRRKFTMTQILNHLVQSKGSAAQYVLVDGENEPWEL